VTLHAGSAEAPLHVTLKLASRCNLDCSYCYVYNKEDQSWRDRPARMSDEVVEATIERLRRHCERSNQAVLRIVLHGGEPMMAGAKRVDRWCTMLRDGLADVAELKLAIQTNGTLVNDEWTELFARHRIVVGVSIDGPPEIHDAFRVDRRGRGSYRSVIRGVDQLRDAGVQVSFLTVAQLGADPVPIHRHLVGLGPAQIEYLLPDQTHETIGAVRAEFGATPGADFLIPIFEEWWSRGTMDIRVGPFTAIARSILGGECEVDFIGNNPLGYLFVESDGSIEGLDVLRVCGDGMAATGLNVMDHDFAELEGLHRSVVFDGMPLPAGCRACPERETCAGGYLPHRYSAERGFDNPSAWCADLLKLFGHIRMRLEVGHEETALRRQALGELAREARGVPA
jgi:uncharacterized protein